MYIYIYICTYLFSFQRIANEQQRPGRAAGDGPLQCPVIQAASKGGSSDSSGMHLCSACRCEGGCPVAMPEHHFVATESASLYVSAERVAW